MMQETGEDRPSARAAAGASFGAIIALVTGATAIGVAIIAAIGAVLALVAGRKRAR
jgi:hypothetical protein